ncbi:hypothetical protein VKT23_016559 [Stygiomarasmius scandens]|uniref:Myb/SANT-like domain-containing protein n=1 Tax=Marasmiellus scandens TaxID=2682957 RepID=A0ABR1IUI8_9AGAR
MTSRNRTNDAKWSDSDCKHLVDFFYEHRFEMGDGGNPVGNLLTEAAAYMAEKVPNPGKGGPKTSASCRTKWNALKAVYEELRKAIIGQIGSGFKYTNDRGFDIQPGQSHHWDEFVRYHPKLKPFRNKGWPLYDRMDEIVPAKVSGKHVFNASQTAQADGNNGSTATINTPAAQGNNGGSPSQGSAGDVEGQVEPVIDNGHAESQIDPVLLQDSPASPPLTPVPTPSASATDASSLGKRSSASDVETPAGKRTKVTGPEAILSMSRSVLSIGDAIRDAFGQKGEPSPDRKAKAKEMLQDDGNDDVFNDGLTDNERARLHILFTRDVCAADAYRTASPGMRLAVARALLASSGL